MTWTADRKTAHELNNQLGVIVSFAELLLDELDAEYRHRGEIEAIDCAARRLMQLLDAGQLSETAAGDLRVRCGSYLAIISRACDSVLKSLPAADPVAADVSEMRKAADAVGAITAAS